MVLSEFLKDAELLNSVAPKSKDLEVLDKAHNTAGILFTCDGLLSIGIKNNFNFNATFFCRDLLEKLKELKKECGAKVTVDVFIEDSKLIIYDGKSEREVQIESSFEEKELSKNLVEPLKNGDSEDTFQLNTEFLGNLKYHYKFTIPKSRHEIFRSMHCIYNKENDLHYLVTSNNDVFVFQEIILSTKRSFLLCHNFMKCLSKIKLSGIFSYSDGLYKFKAGKYMVSLIMPEEVNLVWDYTEINSIINSLSDTRYSYKGNDKELKTELVKDNYSKQLETVLKLSSKIGFNTFKNKQVIVGKIPYGFIAIMEQ